MEQSLHEALLGASKEELIDIIEERSYLDPVFLKTLRYRLLQKEESAEEKIRAFQEKVREEMTLRYPDTSVLRSAGFTLKREMDHFSTYEYLLACAAIIRAFDDALCNGAGMEDESDFELSMDIETAQEMAISKVKDAEISSEERKKITEFLEEDIKKPLDVYDTDLFIQILRSLQ